MAWLPHRVAYQPESEHCSRPVVPQTSQVNITAS
jgi:hypothetical protein